MEHILSWLIWLPIIGMVVIVLIPRSQEDIIKKVVTKLYDEGVVHDINGNPKAPPSLRLWGGATVQNSDMKTLLPWIDWAYNSIKNNV